jgi:hypothetical protein
MEEPGLAGAVLPHSCGSAFKNKTKELEAVSARIC